MKALWELVCVKMVTGTEGGHIRTPTPTTCPQAVLASSVNSGSLCFSSTWGRGQVVRAATSWAWGPLTSHWEDFVTSREWVILVLRASWACVGRVKMQRSPTSTRAGTSSWETNVAGKSGSSGHLTGQMLGPGDVRAAAALLETKPPTQLKP